MSKITIRLNGDEKKIEAGQSLADLIRELALDLEKIAIEKDLEIVNPEQFAAVFLEEGNQIEIVHFIGGG